MSNKIHDWLYNLKSRYKIINTQLPARSIHIDIVADSYDKKQMQRIAQAFEEQKQRMDTMAMVPHSCDDPTSCTNPNCFVWEPDIIVGQPYEVDHKSRERI